jgi:hypothetical protein
VEPVTLTSVQAYEAMRTFVAQFNEREPADQRETIDSMLRWTELEPDGTSYDPAQWEDWKAAVAAALGLPFRAPPPSSSVLG